MEYGGEENNDNEQCEILLSEEKKWDFEYKIIIIGNAFVGKSGLITRVKTRKFEAHTVPTLTCDYITLFLKYKNKTLKLDIYDTCGQEKYRSLFKSYYTASSLVIIVYAIDDSNSFNSIEGWVREVKSYCNPEIKVFLIGNKADLDDK